MRLDGIEFGALGKKEHKIGVGTFDGLTYTSGLMRRRIILNGNVADLKGRREHLLDISEKEVVVLRFKTFGRPCFSACADFFEYAAGTSQPAPSTISSLAFVPFALRFLLLQSSGLPSKPQSRTGQPPAARKRLRKTLFRLAIEDCR